MKNSRTRKDLELKKLRVTKLGKLHLEKIKGGNDTLNTPTMVGTNDTSKTITG